MKPVNLFNYKIKVLNVIDGDTFEASVDLGFFISTHQRFRIMNLDTPEIFHPKNEVEKAHGVEAKIRATQLLMDKEISVEIYKTEKYGRFLATVTLPDGRDFGEVMRREGFSKREKY